MARTVSGMVADGAVAFEPDGTLGPRSEVKYVDLEHGDMTATGHVVITATNDIGGRDAVIAPCARCYRDDERPRDANHRAEYGGDTASLSPAFAATAARFADLAATVLATGRPGR